jgi:Ca2+-binding RTX toxin-like protein
MITGGGAGQAYGNAGDDTIFGGDSGERLVGGSGIDVCVAGGNDVVVGCESKLEG